MRTESWVRIPLSPPAYAKAWAGKASFLNEWLENEFEIYRFALEYNVQALMPRSRRWLEDRVKALEIVHKSATLIFLALLPNGSKNLQPFQQQIEGLMSPKFTDRFNLIPRFYSSKLLNPNLQHPHILTIILESCEYQDKSSSPLTPEQDTQ